MLCCISLCGQVHSLAWKCTQQICDAGLGRLWSCEAGLLTFSAAASSCLAACWAAAVASSAAALAFSTTAVAAPCWAGDALLASLPAL